MAKKNLKTILIGIASAIVLTLCAQLLYFGFVYIEKRTNHAKVLQLVDRDLTYEWDALDEQLSLTLDWIENRHLTNGDKGRLYERASLVNFYLNNFAYDSAPQMQHMPVSITGKQSARRISGSRQSVSMGISVR